MKTSDKFLWVLLFLIIIAPGVLGGLRHKPQKMVCTTVATSRTYIIPDVSGQISNNWTTGDSSIDISQIQCTNDLIFCGDNPKIPLLELRHTGDIYWKGRLIKTDRELVNGLRGVLLGYKNPVSKRNYRWKDNTSVAYGEADR